jgi:hypothetical protein
MKNIEVFRILAVLSTSIFVYPGGRKMKSWVKSFLLQEERQRIDEHFKGKDQETKEMILDTRIQELQGQEAIWLELSDFFNADFGGGISGPGHKFKCVFGSVLAEMPKNVFNKLRGMKNLFIAYCLMMGGAELKFFDLEHNMKVGERLIVVVFPFETASRSFDVARGAVAHELAHVYAEHLIPGKLKGYDEAEDEADQIAKNWGFDKEIEALRQFHQVESR